MSAFAPGLPVFTGKKSWQGRDRYVEKGDRHLTIDDNISLILGPEWVALSSCNTGSGVRAEAEAVPDRQKDSR